jgi:hypothetical protein
MDDHPDFLRSTEMVCKPDSRNATSSVLTEVGFQPKTIEDQHRSVAELSLHKAVPDDIRIQFETTKNLYLYAWFVYRFYPVANHHAYACLELALRERFEAELLASGEKKREFGPGLKRLLTYAVETGHLKNENFEVWRHRTEIRARHRTEKEAFDEMERLGLEEMVIDDTRFEIKDEDRDHDYLAIILETLPWFRNQYAHGTWSLDDQALGTIKLVAEIINQIY